MLKKYNNFIQNKINESESGTGLPEGVDEKAYSIIRKAMATIIAQYGFFADLLLTLNIKQAKPEDVAGKNGIKTMVTDGRNIIYNADFTKELYEPGQKTDTAQVQWVLCHEIMHNVLMHFDRMARRDPLVWNYAGDYAINLLLEGIGKRPEKVLYDKQFDNMSTEQIYEILAKNMKKRPPEKGKGKAECPECGANLGGVEVEVTDDGEYYICPECGAKIPMPKEGEGGEGGEGEGPIFPEGKGPKKKCPNCGESLEGEEKEGKKGKGKGKGKKGKDGDEEGSGEGDGGDVCPHCGEPIESGKGKGKAKPSKEPPEDHLTEDDIRKAGALDGKGVTVFKGWEGTSSTNIEEIKKEWYTNTQQAASRHQGTGSDTLQRWIKKLTMPKINWRKELKKFVATCYDKLRYKIPNKREVFRGRYIWGQHKELLSYDSAVIIVDTSGSITDQDLAIFAAEMDGIIKARSIKTIRVIWCDSQICSVQLFSDKEKAKYEKEKLCGTSLEFVSKLKPCGGGGTSFVPPFAWINDNLIKHRSTPSFIIYFTDAYGDAPTNKMVNGYEDRIMWFVTANLDPTALKHLRKSKVLIVDKLID